MRQKHVAVASLALLIGASFASAAAITFTESVTASGSLGSTQFTNALVTLTATGDTSNVTLRGPGWFNFSWIPVSINIASLGKYAHLADVGGVGSCQNNSCPTSSAAVASFSDFTTQRDILDTVGGGFSTYNLATSIGPIAGSSLINASVAFNTDQGSFQITSAGAATFTAQLANAPVSVRQILPQFAFGGGWYSALYFTNTSAGPVSFPVSFTADNASPLIVPAVGGSSTTVSLAAGGTAIIEAPNSGPLNQGYVAVSLPGGVVGYGVFRQSVPGTPDQEAVVQLSSVSATTATLIWDDTNYTTAVAIVNPSAVPTTVSITVRDSSGNILGTSSVALPAQGKTETVLRGLPGLGAMAGARGSAEFNVAFANVAVLGLPVLWGGIHLHPDGRTVRP